MSNPQRRYADHRPHHHPSRRPMVDAAHAAVAERRDRERLIYDRDGRRLFNADGTKMTVTRRVKQPDLSHTQLMALTFAGMPRQRCICGESFGDYRVHRTTRHHKQVEAAWRARSRNRPRRAQRRMMARQMTKLARTQTRGR